MIGRLLYDFNKKFGHGLQTAWRRDVIRWRILKTQPVYRLTDSSCEIHVLTCHRDWLDLIWSLKSFFAVCELPFRVCIHEDGSVPVDGIEALRHHFPDARVIRRIEADKTVGLKLRNYPRCQALRDANVLSLKVFDFATYLESDRMLLLDSDILFFQRPNILLQRISNSDYAHNSLNRDWGMGYSVEPAVAQSMVEFPVQSNINSGLGLMHRQSYELKCFEEWLTFPGILSHPHRIEQTLVGLACSRFGHQFLPEDYDVRLQSTQPAQIVKHYTGPIRHLMYREGLNRVFPLLKGLQSSSEGVHAFAKTSFGKDISGRTFNRHQ
jgi:hypothetical protein